MRLDLCLILNKIITFGKSYLISQEKAKQMTSFKWLLLEID